MEIRLVEAQKEHLQDCVFTLLETEIGSLYFAKTGKAENMMKGSLAKNELYIIVDSEDNSLGFVILSPRGMFGSFPYLHILAVKEQFQNKGIGRATLSYVEQNLIQNHSKIFLLVNESNQRAKDLYIRVGYQEIGKIPDLYKNGVTEYLLMKEL